MPCLNNRLFLGDDESTNIIQLAWAESMVPRKCCGRQPKFGVLPVAPHVDVHGVVAVETLEEEPVRPRNAGNPRHLLSFPDRMISGSRESAKSG
jgi:hypothetical protein